MLAVADLGLDHHVVQFISLVGLVLGVLGTLFLTYDLLGRQNGPLRWFLRITVPALVGLLVPGLLLALANSFLQLPVGRIVYWALTGVVIGGFNGFFVDPPGTLAKRRFAFSVRDATVGALVTFILYAIAAAFDTMGNYVSRLFPYGFYVMIAAWPVAGFWRRLNRDRAATDVRPRWFSGKGSLIGALAGFVLLFLFLAPNILIDAFGPPKNGLPDSVAARAVLVAVVVVIFGLFLGAPAGAVVGGISRYVFWWANSLPERRMQVIGVILILVAFVAQAVEPVTGLFDIPIR